MFLSLFSILLRPSGRDCQNGSLDIAITFPVELITRHCRGIEATFILSDCGFSLVLLIEMSVVCR